MHIVVSKEDFLPALNRVLGIIERKHTLPILGNVLLLASGQHLTVVATDMEIEVRTRAAAKVIEDGQTTVPARKVFDICRGLADGLDIAIKLVDERCVMTAGRGRYVLGTLAAVDFPLTESHFLENALRLEEGRLKQLVDKTAFAMGQQDVRYYLNGLLLERYEGGIRAVATDGHRLARYELECVGEETGLGAVIIPNKAVLELRRQLAVSSDVVNVWVGERAIRFEIGGSVITSKLVDARYPEYQRVIPENLSKEAVTAKEGLRRALARTAVLSNEKYRGVRLSFESGLLRLQAHNPEQEEAVEELELDYSGEATMIGFNVAYLGDVLGAVQGEQVEVRFEDGNSSSVWRGHGAVSETFVVMPMRL